MPPFLRGNEKSQEVSGLLGSVKYQYDYPDGLDFKPGSKLHDKIRDEILDRAIHSASIMSNRHSSWGETDEFLTGFKLTDEEEEKVQNKDPRKPVSIVFPYSYAILETMLSYLTAAFLQDPFFRYEGNGPEDVIGAILLEKVVQQHCVKNKIAINLHTMLRDGLAYGIGPVYPYWDTKIGRVRRRVTYDDGTGNPIYGVEELDNQLLYEGNALRNIDPYLVLPDVNVPITEMQRGEYWGWLERTNYNLLLAEEQGDDDLFNVKYLKHLKGHRSAVYSDDPSGRSIRTGMTKDPYSAHTHVVDLIPMYLRIVPKEWNLSDKETPEKWLFILANDAIIIKATPAGFDHDMFPAAVCAPDFDGYTAAPLSRMEMLNGMQGLLDWSFNSHVANVRKAINDMLIYDPFLVNSADLRDPKPGKLIRLRRPAWGKGVKDAVQQLNVNDITRNNVNDSAIMVQWMQKIAGTNDPSMGAQRQGGPERLTASEFESTAQGTFSRLERIAKMIGVQALQDIGTFFAFHTQQMMEQETYIKVSGQWQETLLKEYSGDIDRGRMQVSPFDLLINYDVIVRDGSVPGGNFSKHWLQLFSIIAGSPELTQGFDVVRIFTHIARNLGAKNVNDFVRRGGSVQPQLMPDEEVAKQVQAGNLAPIRGE